MILLYKTVAFSMQSAFDVLEGRFVNPQTGLLLNYAGMDGSVLLPTQEECCLGMPNHMSWNCPLEDGAYYGGLYLDALVNRAVLLDCEKAAAAAARTAKGLLSLLVNGADSGFIARGYVLPNKAHYSVGSNDQTFPWFYGLWRYTRSPLCSADEKKTLVSSMEAVGKALWRLNFKIPSDHPSMGDRGDYMLPNPADVSKLLFITRALFDLTEDPFWFTQYETFLHTCPPGSQDTRLTLISRGAGFAPYDGESVFYCLADGQAMEDVFGERRSITTVQLFTRAMVDIALRGLCDMLQDTPERELYRCALRMDALALISHIQRHKGFSLFKAPDFSGNWRVMNKLWHPHYTVAETVPIAWAQMPIWFRECPRFPYENAFVREPLYAGYVATLAGIDMLPGMDHSITELLLSIPWDKLYTSTFYAALTVHGQWLANRLTQFNK